MKRIRAAAIFGMALCAGPALAHVHCDVPLAEWQPREALVKKLEEQGWTVRSIRADDGCYKVRASNTQGDRLEGKFDPSTLEPVTREHDHGNDEED